MFAPRNAADGQVRLGFAGALCGADEWMAFLQALDALRADAPHSCRPEVTAFADTDAVPIPASVRVPVRVRGWQDGQTVRRTLSTMDYLYLPLWFDPRRRLHVATSFSTKFVSYLGVGVPILCHVPEYSAVADFVRRHPVGPLLHRTEPDELAAGLRTVFANRRWQRADPDVWRGAAAAFDRTTLVRRFHDALTATTPPAEPVAWGLDDRPAPGVLQTA